MRSCIGASCAAGELQRDETSSAVPAASATLCFGTRMGGGRAKSVLLASSDLSTWFASNDLRNVFAARGAAESLREERKPEERVVTDIFLSRESS